MTPSLRALGQVVRSLRLRRGLNQCELAARMGHLSSASLSRLEVGTGDQPTYRTLAKLAKALGTRVKDLL